jgi:hypothetical protein
MGQGAHHACVRHRRYRKPERPGLIEDIEQGHYFTD